jgi:hypothetical protein
MFIITAKVTSILGIDTYVIGNSFDYATSWTSQMTILETLLVSFLNTFKMYIVTKFSNCPFSLKKKLFKKDFISSTAITILQLNEINPMV